MRTAANAKSRSPAHLFRRESRPHPVRSQAWVLGPRAGRRGADRAKGCPARRAGTASLAEHRFEGAQRPRNRASCAAAFRSRAPQRTPSRSEGVPHPGSPSLPSFFGKAKNEGAPPGAHSGTAPAGRAPAPAGITACLNRHPTRAGLPASQRGIEAAPSLAPATTPSPRRPAFPSTPASLPTCTTHPHPQGQPPALHHQST